MSKGLQSNLKCVKMTLHGGLWLWRLDSCRLKRHHFQPFHNFYTLQKEASTTSNKHLLSFHSRIVRRNVRFSIDHLHFLVAFGLPESADTLIWPHSCRYNWGRLVLHGVSSNFQHNDS